MAQVTPALSAPSAFRLPWLPMLVGLIAMAALCAREGSLLSPLPLLAVAMLASRFTTWRFEQATQVWMLRLPLFVVVVALGLARPFPDASGLYDPHVICLAGEMLAVEMTLQAWRQRPSGGGQGVVLILLSGLIMLAAADSTEDHAIWFLTPAYTLCLALALPGFRTQPSDRAVSAYGRSPGAWVALALALSFGAATHIAFRVHRDELTEWGMQMLHETPTPDSGGALSTTPTLGASYGLQGSSVRSYRLEGPRGSDLPTHLRVMAYDTYAHRNWLPGENGRALSAKAARDLPPTHPPYWRVTRLLANNGLLAAPLETSGFDPLEQRDVRWASEMGPLKTGTTAVPSSYRIAIGPTGSQGPFCAPPDSQERARLLALPREMDPRVRDIARLAGGNASTAEAKAKAVVAYLPAHHAYSLSYKPGAGDPVSRFLLSASAAHCEYFASSAVLLLRCLGVPARYVIGYYAHERDAGGRIVVRQRDAHAWAEAWIDGEGWITLDATPADGRPDRDGGVPWWTRISEWIEDSLADLRGRLGKVGVPAVLIVVALAGVVIAWRNRPRRIRAGADGAAMAYSTSGEEMAALAARFERLCRRCGLALPPHRTWEEMLHALSLPPEGATAPFDLAAARDFVAAYNAARWGGADTREISRLKELLQAVENSAIGTRRKLTER